MIRLSSALITLLICLGAVAQESASGDHVKIRLLAPRQLSGDSETLIGVHFKLDPHWHVYWKNPGDSGAAPKFAFEAKGAEVGPIQWPRPKRLPIAHLWNIGYEDSVVYLFSIRPNGAGEIDVAIDLEWLVCKEECVPGFGKLHLKRANASGESKWVESDLELVRAFATRLPSSGDQAPFKIEAVRIDNDTLRLRSNAPSATEVFPANGEYISPAPPTRDEKSGEFVFKTQAGAPTPPTLSFAAANDGGFWEFAGLAVSPSAGIGEQIPLWLLVFSSILGGLLLNLMPCVFPVISIKIFSLLKTSPNERVSSSLLYSLGVLVTFTALGALFLVLKSFGAVVGWGFHLQSPSVILALILLFWLMALNFLGVFEFGSSVMGIAGRQSKWSSSFSTGVLSVFVAAPCTGPFMGAALGAAATLSAPAAVAIFLGLGIGLALPFLVFAISPRLLSWLPKPGAWMETLKQFFAFPLFATVIWLMWVLGQQTETAGWLLASAAVLIVSFSLWFGRSPKRVRRATAWTIAIAASVWIGLRLEAAVTPALKQAGAWSRYDTGVLETARAKSQAVFVDFTAAWCITCQVNKQTVLDTEAGQAAFKRAGVLLMRADWTRYDPTITRALSSLGRNSVPVYAFYPSDGSAPKILPQILTLSMIEELNSRQ